MQRMATDDGYVTIYINKSEQCVMLYNTHFVSTENKKANKKWWRILLNKYMFSAAAYIYQAATAAS